MANRRERVPREFDANDDKYFKVLNRTSFLVALVCLAVVLIVCNFIKSLGFNYIPAAVILIIISIVIVALTMIPVPPERFNDGAGNTLAMLLIKKWIRRCSNKLYVKGWNQWLMDTQAAYLVKKMLNENDDCLRYKKREED